MHTQKKLKPGHRVRNIFLSFTALVVFTYILLIIRSLYGADVVFLLGTLAPFYFTVWSIFLLFRTMNKYFMVPVLSGVFYIAANLFRVFYSESLAEYFLIATLFFLAILVYIVLTRKIKFRGREILELAAQPVNEEADGFTARPYVSGEAYFTVAEMEHFSQFLLRHLIAIPYLECNRTVLQLEFSLWHLLKLNQNYSEKTYVSFGNEGTIVVNISKNYYTKYKDELTFDKLCASLADLFKAFLELHKKGAEAQIITRMNELRESVIS